MKTTKFPKLTQVKTVEARLGATRHGSPMPFLRIDADPKAHYRHVHVLAHMIAARLEHETPSTEGWCVCAEIRTDHSAVVRLELVNDDDAEVQRAMALLRSVAEASR